MEDQFLVDNFPDGEIDIEAIMHSVRIRQKERYELENETELDEVYNAIVSPLSIGQNAHGGSMSSYIEACHKSWSVYGENISGGIKGFVKRFLAKGMRWYVYPIMDRQVCFNASATRLLNELTVRCESQQQRIEQLEELVANIGRQEAAKAK